MNNEHVLTTMDQTIAPRQENDTELLAPSIPESRMSILSDVEVDRMIATARRYPRSITRFQQRLMEWAGANRAIAEKCSYGFPRGRGRDKKWITGPSIHFARMLAAAWGHLRVGGMVITPGPTDVEIRAIGVCWDCESNNTWVSEARRRITHTIQGQVERYSDDMINVTGMAAQAIAQRKAVLSVIPEPLWVDIYASICRVAAGDKKTFDERRRALVQWAEGIGLPADALLRVVGVAGLSDIGVDELSRMGMLKQAIEQHEVTVAELLADVADVAEDAGPKGLAATKRAKAEKEKTDGSERSPKL